MNFQSILIITYGRSGSTLLQNIFNSIKGCLIRGENYNFCFHLFESYNAIVNAKNRQDITNIPTNPWYGSSLLNEKIFADRVKSLVKELLLADKINDKNITCYGFKEIRYINHTTMLNSYLEFLEKIFPNVAFVFNTRNIDDVVKSAWWAEKKTEEVRKNISDLESLFIQYGKQHENCFHITYEDIISKSGRLPDMFQFLGAKYDPREIDKVLSLPHSYAPTRQDIKKLFKQADRARKIKKILNKLKPIKKKSDGQKA